MALVQQVTVILSDSSPMFWNQNGGIQSCHYEIHKRNDGQAEYHPKIRADGRAFAPVVEFFVKSEERYWLMLEEYENNV